MTITVKAVPAQRVALIDGSGHITTTWFSWLSHLRRKVTGEDDPTMGDDTPAVPTNEVSVAFLKARR